MLLVMAAAIRVMDIVHQLFFIGKMGGSKNLQGGQRLGDHHLVGGQGATALFQVVDLLAKPPVVAFEKAFDAERLRPGGRGA
ncbi:hypothetical protein GCM10027396_32260 [Insolitispirillum peregrinum]